MTTPAEVILDVFSAIERRDAEGFVALCRPDVEFVWPPSLPYGSATTGLQDEVESHPVNAGPTLTWFETWEQLQPTVESRRMDPRVVGTLSENVVVLWHQRGVDKAGRSIDEEVLGLYQISDFKLARGQMFYFDTTRVDAFLGEAIEK